jgi:hypothetical protein
VGDFIIEAGTVRRGSKGQLRRQTWQRLEFYSKQSSKASVSISKLVLVT